MVRITTWNVNGIRNPFGYQPWREKRSFAVMFDILQADIVIMQELKIQRKDLTDEMVLVNGWDCYFSLPLHKKGYSGVGIYTRQSACAPIRAEEGLLGLLSPPGSSTAYRDQPQDACIGGYPSLFQFGELGVDPVGLDAEGRCLILEFPAFVLFGVYAPANSNGQRDNFRYAFHLALDSRIRNLTKMGKRVILTGDLNVSREKIDTARPDPDLTDEEYLDGPNRRIFNQLLEHGKVPGGHRDLGREQPVLWDLCREFHPNREGMYTHWEQKLNARPGNFGSRIDYVLCSIEMKHWFVEANIQEGLAGSDHCPVYACTSDTVECGGEAVHIADIMNPPGVFNNGVRLREYSAQDLLPLSGKLMPDFTKRRSIKDMFAKRTPNAAQSEVASPLPVLIPTAATQSTPARSPLKSPEKRKALTSQSVKSTKKTKTGTASASKGQQSLKGFFVSKPSGTAAAASSEQFPLPDVKTPAGSQTESQTSNTATKPASQTSVPPPSPKPSADTLPERFIDPEASRESWIKLFSKKPPPRCEHAEPCVRLATKKQGPNFGREFWVCDRPISPSGEKETGTEWRCNTFIWASDWNGSGSQR